MSSDHKVLMFIAAVAVLGAGVRVVRASSGDDRSAAQPALDRQVKAADSAARAGRAGRAGTTSQGRGRQGRARGSRSRLLGDTVKRARDSVARARQAALDGQSYVGRRLDLDVATLVQIDSLPGVSLLMARRIIFDRIAHGPFVTRDGLRRVSGVGQIFLSKIDSLVTFSGTVHMLDPRDTAAPPSRRRRSSPR